MVRGPSDSILEVEDVADDGERFFPEERTVWA